MSTLHLKGHGRSEVEFPFLVAWTVIIVLWGAYSILYDIVANDSRGGMPT